MSRKYIRVVRKAGSLLYKIADRLEKTEVTVSEEKTKDMSSKLVKKGGDRDLYETVYGDLFWLTPKSCVDEEIIKSSVWEWATTDVLRKLVKKGDHVLDIGANIGYDTVVISKIVGDEGKVYAFEPTEFFSKVLRDNIEVNKLNNVEVIQLGLSNKKESLKIEIEDSTATMHVPDKGSLARSETIQLDTLESVIKERNIKKIDFIKLDVDGHEPVILEKAWDILDTFNPTILLEISHMHYLEAGYTAWDFYETLKKRGYYIYNEYGLAEIRSRREFLIICGNFAYSSNIVVSKSPISIQNN